MVSIGVLVFFDPVAGFFLLFLGLGFRCGGGSHPYRHTVLQVFCFLGVGVPPPPGRFFGIVFCWWIHFLWRGAGIKFSPGFC